MDTLITQVLAAGCMAFALLCAHAIAYAAPAGTGGAAALEQGKIRVSGTIVDNEGKRLYQACQDYIRGRKKE